MTQSLIPSENLQALMPNYYCSNCYNVIFGDEKRCPDCGKLKPQNGFTNIEKSLDPWLGRIIADKYFVSKRIGRGGTGSVYRIKLIPFGRTFAVKIVDFANLPADSPVNTMERRLQREIKALSQLNSPHIVQLHEVLELPDGVVGVVMDYINGKTLDQLVQNAGPLRPKRALLITKQIAAGVCEAHNFGMIHRDLKPENIMLERLPNGEDFVHILDFGVVKMDDSLKLTQGFLGTPLYASPEQSMARDVDCRTDIYSLGGILFFLLTASPPFEFTSIFDILQAHAQAALPTLQERTNIVFPAEVETLVRVMLAKEPDDRPSSLDEVIHWIQYLVDTGFGSNPGNHDDPPQPTFRSNFFNSVSLRDSVRITLDPARPGTFDAAEITRPPRSFDSQPNSFDDDEPTEGCVFQLSVADTAELTRKPWMHHDLLILSENVDPDNLTTLSCIPNSQSLAMFFKDGAIIDVGWSGSLTARPGEGPVKASNISTRVARTGLVGVSAFYNCESSYLFGTDNGVVYTMEKNDISSMTPIYTHPDGARVNRLVASNTKFKRKMVAFANGDLYISGDGIGHAKPPTSPDPNAETWVRIFQDRPIHALAITQNGESFVIIDDELDFGVYSFAVPGAPFARSQVVSPVRDVVFSQDGHVIALLREDTVIELRHSISAAKLTSLYDPNHSIGYVSFGANGGFLGYFIEKNMLQAVDLQREIVRST